MFSYESIEFFRYICKFNRNLALSIERKTFKERLTIEKILLENQAKKIFKMFSLFAISSKNT